MWGNVGAGAQYQCVCSGGGQVDSAAYSLTPNPLVIGMDKPLLPNALKHTHTHTQAKGVTHTQPRASSIPRDKVSETE